MAASFTMPRWSGSTYNAVNKPQHEFRCLVPMAPKVSKNAKMGRFSLFFNVVIRLQTDFRHFRPSGSKFHNAKMETA